MRALLALLALLAVPLVAAHPDATDHGQAFVSEREGGEPTRLVAGCAFFVSGTLEPGWAEGRVVVLASNGSGPLRVAAEAEWRADANGSIASGPIDAGPGVFLVGVELDGAHGAYSEAFRVDCLDPVCPPEGCPTYRVSSTAESAPPSALALLGALVGVAILGMFVVWRN